MPQLVVVASRSAEKPADVKVRFHATGASGDRVVIVHPGGSAGRRSAPSPRTERWTGRSGSGPTGSRRAPTRPHWSIPGGDIVSRSRFWLSPPGPSRPCGRPGASTRAATRFVSPGRMAPGMKWDWLGISKAGERRESERPDRRGRHMFERALPPLQVHAHGDPGLDEVDAASSLPAIRRGRSGRAPTGCGSSWTTATSPSRCRRSSRSSSRSTAAEAGSYFELRILYSVGERTGDQGSRLVALGRAIYLPNRKRPGAGVARVIARTDGAAIPTAQDTTTSTAAVTSTASVPNASDAGPASAWPTGLSPSATSQANESTRESRWLGISR